MDDDHDRRRGQQAGRRLSRRKDGSWQSQAVHIIGSGKTKKTARGATETHAAEAEARAAVAKLVAVAEKQGWRKRPSAGFGPRPDAFSLANLPLAQHKAKK